MEQIEYIKTKIGEKRTESILDIAKKREELVEMLAQNEKTFCQWNEMLGKVEYVGQNWSWKGDSRGGNMEKFKKELDETVRSIVIDMSICWVCNHRYNETLKRIKWKWSEKEMCTSNILNMSEELIMNAKEIMADQATWLLNFYVDRDAIWRMNEKEKAEKFEVPSKGSGSMGSIRETVNILTGIQYGENAEAIEKMEGLPWRFEENKTIQIYDILTIRTFKDKAQITIIKPELRLKATEYARKGFTNRVIYKEEEKARQESIA